MPKTRPKAVTIISGGLDSTVLAYSLASRGYEQRFLSFDYGQRHRRELQCAALTAYKLKGEHDIIKLDIGHLLKGSSLTDTKNVAVPEGHYEAETMKATIVPGRNSIMLSIAWGVAVSEQANLVACGVHAGDHAIYEDCRKVFITALDNALNLGTPRMQVQPILHTPFIEISKTSIVKLGHELDVPFKDTHTCYLGKVVADGKCGTCVERLQAFDEAGIEDPLLYEDREFWKQAVANFAKSKSAS